MDYMNKEQTIEPPDLPQPKKRGNPNWKKKPTEPNITKLGVPDVLLESQLWLKLYSAILSGAPTLNIEKSAGLADDALVQFKKRYMQ